MSDHRRIEISLARLARFASTALLLLCATCAVVSAQTANTGAIAGVVQDPTGAVVTGASVSVTNAATAETRTTTSGANGNFVVAQLPPGDYSVTISNQGFKELTYSRVHVNVTETERVNAALQVGAVTEVMTISYDATPLQTESSALGNVTSGREIESLPLVTRNYTQILGLSPGVASDVTNAAELGRGAGGTPTAPFVANGVSTQDNNFQMNGAEINDLQSSGAFSGGVAIPNPDTILEFKVQTGQYDAAYGRDAGANVDVITKGGTNNYHGTIFEFFRNEALNANDYFRNQGNQPRALLRQNQYGFTLGGPIKKEKLLFFSSYQRTQQNNGVASQCSSNFSTPPLTNDRSRGALGTLFAGQPTFFQQILLGAGLPPAVVAIVGGPQVLPDGSNISPQALALLQAKLPNGQFIIPTPQRIDASKPFASQGISAFSIPCAFNEDQFMANSDWNQSGKSTFQLRFFFANSNQNVSLPAANLGGPTSPGFPVRTDQRFRNATLTHDFVFSPHVLNQIQIGYNRQYSQTAQDEVFNFSDIGVNVPAFDNNTPAIAIIGGLTLGGNGQGVTLIQNTYIAQDTLSWSAGRHSFRFGGGVTRNQDNIAQFHFLGGLLFGTFPDFLLGQSGTQTGLPVGNVLGSVDIPGQLDRNYRVWGGNAFAQDDFKLTNRFTVNLGLRYEHVGDIADALGRNSAFDPSAADPNPPAAGSLKGFIVSNNFRGTVPPGVTQIGNSYAIRGDGQNTLNPRVGFAWQLPGSDRVVLRAGYGIYHSRLTGQPFLQLVTNLPFAELRQIVGAANAGASFANPFPANTPTFPSFIPYSPTTQLATSTFAQNFRPPVVQQYSLNTQLQLTQDMVFQVGFVGARGTHLIRSLSVNQALSASASNPIRGQTTNTLANIPLRVPFQGWNANRLTEFQSEGANWYNSMQTNLSKRFKHGLQFLLSYTWSKDLTTELGGANGVNGGTAVGDQNSVRRRYGSDDFIRPQRFVASYVYELPGPKNHASVLGELLAGWRLAGVTTLQSGHQLSIISNSATNAFGIQTDFAQLAPTCTNAQVNTGGSVESKLNNYINSKCFTTPPVIGADGVATDFGNSGVGIARGPKQVNTDVSLVKQFRIAWPNEATNLEFRTEAFNVFNTPQFADPNNTFGTATFGQVLSTAANPRILQLALKINF